MPKIALLLAALWLPLTMHCDLERLTGFEFLACAEQAESQPHSNKDCTTDLCAVVESGSYKVEEQPLSLPAPTLSVAYILPLLADELPARTVSFGLNDFAPPELSHGWQFLLRTALSPRAPS